MLTFKFNFPKTFQAAATVLREHHGRMEFVRLLKLLYIADRELLAKTGRTLTGDQPVALPRGPVLDTVYALIKGKGPEADQSVWGTAIRKDGREVVLDERATVGTGRLTKAEVNKLREVCARFYDTDSETLSELTHKFDEWAEVFEETSRNPIDWEKALIAQGMGELVEEARERLRERELAAAAFREL